MATYDYAHYNEKILQNKSYIIHFSDNAQKNMAFLILKIHLQNLILDLK